MIAADFRFARFVGREAELAYLLRRVEATREDGGSVVLIVSPPGRGKSRLVREFRRRLDRPAINFALGGNLHRAQPPFSPFKEALGEAFRESLFDSAPARVLAIEDLQWADDSTLELVAHVCRHIADLQMLLLLTLRTQLIPNGESTPALANLLPSLPHVLELAPLSVADTRSLLNDVLNAYPMLSSEVVGQIERNCGGNPLYLEELLSATLREVDGPRVRLPELSVFQSSVLRASAQLPPSTRSVLAGAAVVGLSFDSRIVADVTSQEEAPIAEALQSAFARGFIAPANDRPHHYAFADPIVRNVLYDGVSPHLRASMHGKVATAFEGRPEFAARYAELSDQWYASEQPERSVKYAERAGALAETSGDYFEAARFYERARNFKPPSTRERAEMCRRLASALMLSGFAERSRRYFEEAIAFYVASGDSHRAVELLCSLASAIWHQGDTPAAIDIVERALAGFATSLDAPATAQLLLAAADLCDVRGIADRSRAFLERFEALPCRKPRALQVRYHSVRARVLMRRGEFSEAVMEFGKSLALLNKVRDVKLRVAVLRNFSACLRLAGRFEEAEAQGQASLQYARSRHAGRLVECELTLVQADLLSLRGKLREATALLESVIAQRADFGICRFELLACGLPIALAVDREDLVSACCDRSLLDGGLSGFPPVEKGRIAYALAKLHHVRGEIKKARAVIRQGLRSIESAEFAELLMLAVAEFGASSDFPRARELLAISQNNATPAFVTLFEAFVAHRGGRPRECQTFARRAAIEFDRLGVPLLAARSLELAGEQRRALGMYKCVGAARDVKRLENVFSLRGLKGRGALTRRQIEIGRHIAAGRGNRAIAQGLQISIKTLESHLTAIYDRLGVRSRSEIAAYVLDHNIC